MRLNERSFVVLVAGFLVLAVAAALGWWFLVREEGPVAGEGETPVNAAVSLVGGPPEVLILNGTALVRRNLEDQTEEIIGEIDSPNVYAAPGSQWLASVVSKQGSAEDDFAPEPRLRLHDGDTGEDIAVGPGVAPVWNDAGTRVAFLRPVEPRSCVGETCSGATQIGIAEAGTGDLSVLRGPARYSILGWAGDRVMVSDFDDPTKVLSVTLDDEVTELDMPASQFWGASPDGSWVIKTNAKKTEFIALEDGGLGEERIEVELGRHQLLQGSWSHDSSTVAAVTTLPSSLEKGSGKVVEQEPTTQVVTFSPEEPEVEVVDRSYGASGAVLWSPDNTSLVFSSLLDPQRALFQAKHCPLGNSEECVIVTSYTEGVVLLRAE